MGVVVVWCDDPQAGLGANGIVVRWFEVCGFGVGRDKLVQRRFDYVACAEECCGSIF